MTSLPTTTFRRLIAIVTLLLLVSACGTSVTVPAVAPGQSLAAGSSDADSAASAPISAGKLAAAGEVEQGRTPEGAPFLGRADAPVTMVIFSDFLCLECGMHAQETEPQIVGHYVRQGAVRLVFRHLVISEKSLVTAEAAQCAADQQAFWSMHDLLYEQQRALYGSTDIRATVLELAGQLSLDLPAFTACLDTQTHQAQVEQDLRAAQAAGVRARPAFDINGTRIAGALPFESFQQTIEAALKR